MADQEAKLSAAGYVGPVGIGSNSSPRGPSPVEHAIETLKREVAVLNEVLGVHADKLSPVLMPIDEKENADPGIKSPRHPVSVVAALHDITTEIVQLREATMKLTHRVAL